MITIDELAKRIRFNNGFQGFVVDNKTIYQKLLLAVSEICEAEEELRDGHAIEKIYFNTPEGERINYSAKYSLANTPIGVKPEGFPVEIADAIIRLLDICVVFDINIEEVILLKLEYNQTRPPKHGKQF